MKIKKIGMRTIKTTFAVFITIVLAQTIGLKSPFFAGIAAMAAMQTSVSESLHVGVDRMRGTILGAVIALLFSLVAPENPIFIGMGTLLVIYVCNLLELKQSTQLSTIVFLSIILNHEEANRIGYALYRTLDTFIGLSLGTLINYFILPPNIEDSLISNMKKLYSHSLDIVEKIVYDKNKITLSKFKEELIIIDDDFSILKRDRKLNLHDDCNISNFRAVLRLFENTYYHMGILNSINGPFKISRANRKNLEDLFERDFPQLEIEDNRNLDLIYNYHLRNILKNISSIESNIDVLVEAREYS